jgi:hypothetical protein
MSIFHHNALPSNTVRLPLDSDNAGKVAPVDFISHVTGKGAIDTIVVPESGLVTGPFPGMLVLISDDGFSTKEMEPAVPAVQPKPAIAAVPAVKAQPAVMAEDGVTVLKEAVPAQAAVAAVPAVEYIPAKPAVGNIATGGTTTKGGVYIAIWEGSAWFIAGV